MALNLRHEVHYDHNHDQHRRSAQIEWDVEHHYEELRQQTHQRDVGGSKNCQTRQDAINVICCLLTRSNTRHKCTGTLQVVRHFAGIEHQRCVEETEEDNEASEQDNVKGLTGTDSYREVLQPIRTVSTTKPLRYRRREQQNRTCEDGGDNAGHIDLERQVRRGEPDTSGDPADAWRNLP